MPVETLPWSIQGQSHPATVARNHTAALLGAPAAALAAGVQITTAGGSHGVVAPGDFAVAQNGTPNMSVNVAAGRAFIRGTETASLNQGTYSVFNDGTVNLAVAASDPSNPRRDLVVAQVRDANYSGAANDARLFVVTGTPASSPSDPTVPANCLVLARIAVAAGSTSVLNAAITDLRTRAVALGGTLVCTSTTRPSGASLYPGLRIFETDALRERVWDGTAWQVVSGRVGGTWYRSNSTITVATGGTTTVTFDNELDDTDNFGVATGSAYTVPAGLGGLYIVWAMFYNASIAMTANSLTNFIDVNAGPAYQMPGTSGTSSQATVTVPLRLSAGDAIRLKSTNNTGASFTANAALALYRFSA